ncbi:MAG: nucleoside triphosphate pyrophosphohydrolase [Candidatus Rokubacteria bacterium GWC2_70_16]|nr:MAG: nucleoside triphosphate pyrophosphohydrolase [Candidatus Rokubacteria bacterium GWC2_70_16]
MADAAGALFESLLSVMTRLRAEGGCPWDREQTRESLKPYLIEEAYEALEAIDEGSPEHIMEELGDVLFQVVFHCQVASEQGEFTMAHLLARLHDKMVRRHPHVFGDGAVANAQEALSQWERIKRGEGGSEGGPRSALEGVPRNLPALLRAQRLQSKAGRLGFDWPSWEEAWAKVREEVGELDRAAAEGNAQQVREELGDLLFSMVNAARLLGVDAEDCLRQAAEKFTRRFKEVEAAMRATDRTVGEASPEQLDLTWEAVKSRELGRGTGSGGAP